MKGLLLLEIARGHALGQGLMTLRNCRLQMIAGCALRTHTSRTPSLAVGPPDQRARVDFIEQHVS